MFGCAVRSKPSASSVSQADLGRALLRVGRLERREPAHVGRVVARRNRLALVAEQLREPALAQGARRRRRVVARLLERPRELAQRDVLLLLVALDRVGDARSTRPRAPRSTRSSSRRSSLNCALASAWIAPSSSRSAYAASTRELRLRVAQRHLLAAERHARGEHAVLELVLALGELGGDQPGLAGLAQAVEELALVAGGALLGLPQRVELLAAEEVGVAADDLGLLGDLLLPHPHGAPLLGALEQVPLEARLELGRAEDGRGAHGPTLARRRAVSTRIARLERLARAPRVGRAHVRRRGRRSR